MLFFLELCVSLSKIAVKVLLHENKLTNLMTLLKFNFTVRKEPALGKKALKNCLIYYKDALMLQYSYTSLSARMGIVIRGLSVANTP